MAMRSMQWALQKCRQEDARSNEMSQTKVNIMQMLVLTLLLLCAADSSPLNSELFDRGLKWYKKALKHFQTPNMSCLLMKWLIVSPIVREIRPAFYSINQRSTHTFTDKMAAMLQPSIEQGSF